MSDRVPFQPLLPFDAEPAPTPRLLDELARVCRELALEEKILVAPSLAIGHQLVERLARRGDAWINLRVETVRTLASRTAGPEIAQEGLKVLSRAQALALVEQACFESLSSESYFGQLRDRPGLHRALHTALDELRAAGLSADSLPARVFADPRKHRELVEILRRYSAALEQGRFVDGIEVMRRALATLEARPAASTPSHYLLPAGAELSALERRLLERIAAGRLTEIPVDPPTSWSFQVRTARLFRAVGEENEIREIFRRILAEAIPFDEVEILHTDSTVYPSLAFELSQEQEIPSTFAEGIAVTYTHPGQAALAFLDWIAQGFAADILRRALASGSLTLAQPAAGRPGTRAVARAMREAAIGWGRARHRRCLDRLIAELKKLEEPSRQEVELSDEQQARRKSRRARRLEAARRARAFVERALELAPPDAESQGDLPSLAAGTRAFISEFGRISDELDATARTALETLLREFEELVPLRLTAAAAAERLRDAVERLSIASDRPRPGCLHVASFRSGGFSGRRQTFLVGLDEARASGLDLEDPVLLDFERRGINDAFPGALLALGREKPRQAARALQSCLARLRSTVTASYSSFDLRNLSQAGEPAPSPFLLELFRIVAGSPEADYEALAAALRHTAGFLPRPEAALDETEWWLGRLLSDRGGSAAAGQVRRLYPWLEDGARAQIARASDAFTVWDGWISSGAPELDPRSGGEPFSPSRVEDLARCPFAYFLRHVLSVDPPKDLEEDPTRWLAPIDEGSLLHEVFKEFLEELTESGKKPHSQHWERLATIAEARIEIWKERVPPRSELAFGQTRSNVLFACRTFLRLEEEHCREVTPRYYEVPFGRPRELSRTRCEIASAEPVTIAVGPGHTLRLRGSIDRVDEAADGTFHVWDYKTGSAWKFREGAGLGGGRQIQPALYALAFEALLQSAGRTGRVSRSGYFFPGRRGEGRRVDVPLDPAQTQETLRRLFDLLKAGYFPHARREEDCRYCGFEAICGGAATAREQAKRKIAASTDPALTEFGRLDGASEEP